MKKILVLDTQCEGYGVDQISKTLTVGELIELLRELDEDMEVYTAHDRRYTYGGVNAYQFAELTVGERGEVIDEEVLW